MSKSSKKNKPENDSPAGGSTPDWMGMAASETDSSSINEENTPDWLKSIQAGKSTENQADASLAEMSDLERLLAEEGIDLGAVEDDRPADAEGMSARDWLIETSDDELIRNRGRESDDLDLSLDAQTAQPMAATATSPETTAPVTSPPSNESSDDDPFAGMSDLERMLAEEGIDVGSVEDERPADAEGKSAREWLLETSDDEMIRNRAKKQEEIDLSLDVTQSPPPSEVESAPAAESVTPPTDDDPFTGMSDLERMLAEEGIDVDSVEDERPADAEGMSARDYLLSTSDDEMLRNKAGQVQEEIDLSLDASDDGLASSSDGVPNWLEEDEGSSDEADEALPDWLTSDDDETPASSEPDKTDDELPDWLTSDDDEADSDDDMMVVEDGLPDWLQDDNDADQAASTPSSEADDALPDWLADEASQDSQTDETLSENFADDDDELPDWLTSDDDDDSETVASLMETSAQDEGDLMVVEDELPDWLMDDDDGSETAVAETSTDTASTDDDDGLPDWLTDDDDDSQPEGAPTQDSAQDEGDLMVVEDELPDWLMDDDDGGEAPIAETSIDPASADEDDELPDWLTDDDDDSQPEGAPTQDSAQDEGDLMVVEDELPDWLMDDASAESEAQPAAATSAESDGDMMVMEDDLPDWLQDGNSAEGETESTVVDDDMPDWLQNDASAESETEPVEAEDDDELPDWLQEESDDPLANGTTAEITEELTDDDDLPDWLKEVSDEIAEPPSQELNDDISVETEDDMPDWLQDAADEIDKESDSLPLLEDDSGDELSSDMPDWLSETEDGPDGVTAVLAGAAAGVAATAVSETDLPDWLQDVQEEEMELESQLPVTNLETEPETTETAEVDDANLPAWLRDDEVDDADETSSETDAEAPDWLAEEDSEDVEPVVEKSPVQAEPSHVEVETAPVIPDNYKGDLPDWLRKLRAGDQQMNETTQLGVFSVPVPMSAPVLTPQYGRPTAQAAPQPTYQAQPIKPPRAEPDANSTKQLEAARNAQQSGNLDVALKTYASLVSNGVYLDKVIDDLQRATDNTASNHKLYQLMGDAMLRDGRLQSALEAYRQGLASMQR